MSHGVKTAVGNSCLDHFKLHRGNGSCTKWKNVLLFFIFFTVLEGFCQPARSEQHLRPPLPPCLPPLPFTFSAWNRHSCRNGFPPQPRRALGFSCDMKKQKKNKKKNYQHMPNTTILCNFFFMQQPFSGNNNPSFLTTTNRYKVRFFVLFCFL